MERGPTELAKPGERGGKGWFGEGFLWLEEKQWDRAGNDFEVGARRGVASGMVHR